MLLTCRHRGFIAAMADGALTLTKHDRHIRAAGSLCERLSGRKRVQNKEKNDGLFRSLAHGLDTMIA